MITPRSIQVTELLSRLALEMLQSAQPISVSASLLFQILTKKSLSKTFSCRNGWKI